MTTAREDLVAHLQATLPAEVKIIPAIAAVPNAKTAVVLVSRSTLERSPQQGTRDDVLTVWLLSPLVDLVAAEADLDVTLDVVLAAIESHPYLHWRDGRRDLFADAYHAFAITVPHRTIIEEP